MSASSEVIFDTNAAIEWMIDQGSFNHLFVEECVFYATATVLGELYFGAEKSARRSENMVRIEQFLNVVTVIEIDRETARKYGRVEASLRARRCVIPQNDMWIAASAIQHGIALLTRDTHFDNVSALKLIRF